MEDEIKKVITIEVQGDQTVKGLKQEISDLKDALLNTEKGSEEYRKTLDLLIEDQKKLTEVMNAGKNEIEAAEGSYNALQNEMTALKKVWREVTDEASRNEIGARILTINEQLKDMDASIGNFQRNVGDYSNAIEDATKNVMSNLGQISPGLASLGKNINSLIPIITKTNKVAVTGLKGIKKAIVSTGIGALIVALGLLLANWDKVSDAIAKVIPWMKKSNEETQKQIDENKELIETNKTATEEMEYQARIMAAQGKSSLEIIQYKKKETEAILANTEAQIKETEAKIASIKAHSAFGRWIRGENKQLKGLEESLETLVKEQESLAKSVKKLGQDIVVEETKIQYNRNKTTKNASEERIEIEKEEAKKKYEILKKYAEDVKALTKGLSDERTKLQEDYAEDTKTLTQGLYADILLNVRKAKLPEEIKKLFDKLDLTKFTEKAKQQIQSIFNNIDYKQSDLDINKYLQTNLAKVDLKGVGKSVQKKFQEFIKNINLNSVGKELDNKIGKFIERLNNTTAYLKDDLSDIFSGFDFSQFSEKLLVDIADAFSTIDLTKEGDALVEQFNTLKQRLTQLDLSTLTAELQEKFNQFVDNLNVDTAGNKLKEKVELLTKRVSKETTLLNDSLKSIFKGLDFSEFGAEFTEQIGIVFQSIDLSKSDKNIVKQLKDSLDALDLSSLPQELQNKFKKAVDAIDLSTVSKDLIGKLNVAFSSLDLDSVIGELKLEFAGDEEMMEIINQYEKYYKKLKDNNEKALKELHTTQLNTINKHNEDVRKQQEKNAETLIKITEKQQQFEAEKNGDKLASLKATLYAENALYNIRNENLEKSLDEYKAIMDDEMATDDARKEAAEKYNQALIDLNNNKLENELFNEEQLEKIRNEEKNQLQQMVNHILDFSNTIGDILGSVAGYWEDYVKDQVEAGKMSKEEGKKQFEWIKALQIAQTTIQTIAAAMAAFNGITSSTGGWGVAAAAAEMAAVLTTGALQIAKIRQTTLDSSSSSSVKSGAQVRVVKTDYQPHYVASQTGESETTNLANAMAQQPIWVSVRDIDSAQSRVQVREQESSW